MSSVPLSAVPIKLHRLAAQLLEEIRGSETIATWKKAQLAAVVEPLYRPDVDTEAYYEFPVVIPSDGAEPAGFIIVSTGDHDYPIAHWNSDGISPCEELRKKAQEAGGKAVTFFKLDTLAYAAEDDAGELVATSDAQLFRVNGLDVVWLDEDFPLTESTWKPYPEMEDDSNAGEIDGVLEVSGPESLESIEVTGWKSWGELKAEYSAVYELLIESLRRQASADWQIDNLAEEHGEGLTPGETYRLACLYKNVEYKVLGPGADLVKVELVEHGELPPALDIQVLDSAPDEEVPLEISLDYPDESIYETVKFAIVAPQEEFGFRVIKLNPSRGPWSRWQEYFAGTNSDQRWYDQIAPHTSPNTNDCYSGCGNTAWAMLFGWGDLMADRRTSRWRNRWGLYLRNGGRGSNAVAPSSRDAGVSNMIWEIHNWTRSFCDPFSTNCATLPGRMDRASGYLRGRTGTRLHVRCNVLGIQRDSLRRSAADVIRYSRDPAIIGTGFLAHYPLAYGYRVRWRQVRYGIGRLSWTRTEYGHQFYVNQGNGGSRSWVGGGTWFAGWITPN